MFELDHLAVSAHTLAEGIDYVEQALGVSLQPGGKHAHMATHNALLGLGDVYLEVIAADPEAAAPTHPRWFDLDHFAGTARLTNWVVRCDDLEAGRAVSPPGIGAPISLSRGDLRWQMVVPATGRLPFDGAYPALIHWQGRKHPAQILAECGCELRHLEIIHPEDARLRVALGHGLRDDRITVSHGETVGFSAEIQTATGRRILT